LACGLGDRNSPRSISAIARFNLEPVVPRCSIQRHARAQAATEAWPSSHVAFSATAIHSTTSYVHYRPTRVQWGPRRLGVAGPDKVYANRRAWLPVLAIDTVAQVASVRRSQPVPPAYQVRNGRSAATPTAASACRPTRCRPAHQCAAYACCRPNTGTNRPDTYFFTAGTEILDLRIVAIDHPLAFTPEGCAVAAVARQLVGLADTSTISIDQVDKGREVTECMAVAAPEEVEFAAVVKTCMPSNVGASKKWASCSGPSSLVG
jgi:hypothetical protein